MRLRTLVGVVAAVMIAGCATLAASTYHGALSDHFDGKRFHNYVRFRDAQLGTTHRALTLEDGSLVVTGNYLKLRIPPGCPRNAWVNVRVVSHDHGELLAG